MSTATLTSKGQVTIPIGVRQALHVDTGDRLEFIEVEPGRFEIVPLTRSVKELKGLAAKRKKPVSIEDMNRAIVSRGASAR
jgi:AbrB family looped-hinge helix DNA binding protein